MIVATVFRPYGMFFLVALFGLLQSTASAQDPLEAGGLLAAEGTALNGSVRAAGADEAWLNKAVEAIGQASGAPDQAIWSTRGNQTDGRFGFSAAYVGDVNRDGMGDVLVGMPYFDWVSEDVGGVFLFYGTSEGLSTSVGWSYYGEWAGENLGWSVASAGDVNGDNAGDFVVGAPNWTAPNGLGKHGRVLLFEGGEGGPSSEPDWRLEHNFGDDQPRTGYSLAGVGDINGDGYDDIAVGSPYAGYEIVNSPAGWTMYSGRAYVYYGGPNGMTGSNWFIAGTVSDTHIGWSVGAEDVNGDGTPDLIVGVPGFEDSDEQDDEGAVWVYHGPIESGDAWRPADWTIDADQPEARLGESVAGLGDVNGDGFGDVIVGAPYYDMEAADDGLASIFHGSGSGLAAQAGWTVWGGQSGARFGWSVAGIGDHTGDLIPDIAVGAPYFDGPSTGAADGGIVAIFAGGTGIISTTYETLHEGEQAGGHLGWSVASAGDVNRDAAPDLLVGAPGYTGSVAGEGQVFVFAGPEPSVTVTGSVTHETSLAGIGGITIRAAKLTGEVVGETTTNADGTYAVRLDLSRWATTEDIVLEPISDTYRFLPPGQSMDINYPGGRMESTGPDFTAYVPPAGPELVSPIDGADPTWVLIDFKWTPQTGAAQYILQISTDEAFSLVPQEYSSTNSSYALIDPLLVNSGYFWRVRTEYENGKISEWSEVWSLTTGSSTVVNLQGRVETETGQPVAGARIRLNGGELGTILTNAEGVYRFEGLQTPSARSSTTFFVEADDPSGTYGFDTPQQQVQVTADFSLVQEVEASADPFVAYIRPVGTALVAPANGSTDVATAPLLTWTHAEDAARYLIQVATNDQFSDESLVWQVRPSFEGFDPGAEVSFAVEAGILQANTSYFWRVAAERASDDRLTQFTEVWQFTTGTEATGGSRLTVTGRVTNSSNAGIGGVEVLLTEVDETFTPVGEPIVAATDGSGAYTIRDVGFSAADGAEFELRAQSDEYSFEPQIRVLSIEAGSAEGSLTYSDQDFTGSPKPGGPVLVSPADASIDVSLTTQLSWQALASAVLYYIEILHNGVVIWEGHSESTSIHIPDELLSEGSTYAWRVMAYYPDYTTTRFSETWQFTTQGEPTVSAGPELTLPADAAVDQSPFIVLSWEDWNPEEGDFSYDYQLSTSASFDQPVFEGVAEVSGWNLDGIVKLHYGTRYHWRVRAVDTEGPASEWSNVFSFTTVDEPLPPTVAAPAQPFRGATDVSLRPRLTWQQVSGAASYSVNLYRRGEGVDHYLRTFNVDSDTSVVIPVGVLDPETRYAWDVEAVPTSGPALPTSGTFGFTTAAGQDLVRVQVLHNVSAWPRPVDVLVYTDENGDGTYENLVREVRQLCFVPQCTPDDGEPSLHDLPSGTSLEIRAGVEVPGFGYMLLPMGVVEPLEGGRAYVVHATGADFQSIKVGYEVIPPQFADTFAKGAGKGTFNETAVIFWHGLSDAAAVDVTDRDSGEQVASNVSFGEHGGFVMLAAGPHTLDVHRADTDHLLGSFEVDFTSQSGRAVNVVASGFLSPPTTDAPGFSMVAVTEEGSTGPAPVVTGSEIAGDVPAGFRLLGNYPNPFNPVTTIGFELAQPGVVTLAIYDMLGREVSILVDGVVGAGRHEVTWHAADVPSGSYYYRLSQNGRTTVGQMVLLK